MEAGSNREPAHDRSPGQFRQYVELTSIRPALPGPAPADRLGVNNKNTVAMAAAFHNSFTSQDPGDVMHDLRTLVFSALLVLLAVPVTVQAQNNVLNFTDREIPQGVLKQIAAGKQVTIPSTVSSGKNWGHALTVVKLSGKTNHFGRNVLTGGYIDYWATVPGVRVWFAEHPETRDLDIQTDATGWWTMYVIKHAGVDLELSLIYEKDGWITTKSNVLTIGDVDDTDLAIQYIDPLYYQAMMKPYVEGVFLGGKPIENAMVVTVGKSWSSMHDGRLPHGDPGALAIASPAKGVGPIYFNRQVIPDPTQVLTSVDGGVTWLNVPHGTYQVTASKAGVIYPTVKFRIDEADHAHGVELYIASPPDSLEGSNDSGPGQP